MLIGLACRALGDTDAAAMELDAAGDAFRRSAPSPISLGWRRRSTRRPDFDRGPHGARARGPATRGRRQVEPCHRGDLVISDRTVARHLSNIFDKLGVSSRAAATAYAYEHDLVARPA